MITEISVLQQSSSCSRGEKGKCPAGFVTLPNFMKLGWVMAKRNSKAISFFRIVLQVCELFQGNADGLKSQYHSPRITRVDFNKIRDKRSGLTMLVCIVNFTISPSLLASRTFTGQDKPCSPTPFTSLSAWKKSKLDTPVGI